MNDIVAYSVAAFVFIILGTVWVKGLDIIRQRSPQSAPTFYYATAVLRVFTVLLMLGIYRLLSDDRESSIRFAAVLLIMYAVMMIVTLIIKH